MDFTHHGEQPTNISRLAQARTGTGKTLAFLVPVLQNILAKDPSLADVSAKRAASSEDIRAIIVSPTRELAQQIAAEATKVVKKTGIVIQIAVGGTSKREDLREMKRLGCHILVGTPGRLSDLLSDSYARVSAPNLSAFVMDEADRLLDQGFEEELENIFKMLPDRNDKPRQTLMFSATVPREVMHVVRKHMGSKFAFVRTVQPDEQQTHERVPQMLVTTNSLSNQLVALYELCLRGLSADAERPLKAIVFFNATAEASLAAQVFMNLKGELGGRETMIVEMHSKLSQDKRTRTADRFRESKQGIMLCSDVVSRGMDFPDVTHVIQMGVPGSKDTYVHRIGRTARAGKEGEGWLIIAPPEQRLIGSLLRGIDLKPDTTLKTAAVDIAKDAELPADVARMITQVVEAAKSVDEEYKSAAFRASLGSLGRMGDKTSMLEQVVLRCIVAWGMTRPPSISPLLAAKLSLPRVPGIIIGRDDRHADREWSSGSGSDSRSFDRPSRSFGGEGRPRREFDSRRSFGGDDRPRGSLEGELRPRRSFDGGSRGSSYGDSGDKPSRSFDKPRGFGNTDRGGGFSSRSAPDFDRAGGGGGGGGKFARQRY